MYKFRFACLRDIKYIYTKKTEQITVLILTILASALFSVCWLAFTLCSGMCLCVCAVSLTGCTDELPTWLVSIIHQLSSLCLRYLCVQMLVCV